MAKSNLVLNPSRYHLALKDKLLPPPIFDSLLSYTTKEIQKIFDKEME
jgi:hypothetical protein